jgi:hypothetical protein
LLVKPTPRNVNLGNGRFAMFNKERDISYTICHISKARQVIRNTIRIFCTIKHSLFEAFGVSLLAIIEMYELIIASGDVIASHPQLTVEGIVQFPDAAVIQLDDLTIGKISRDRKVGFAGSPRGAELQTGNQDGRE